MSVTFADVLLSAGACIPLCASRTACGVAACSVSVTQLLHSVGNCRRIQQKYALLLRYSSWVNLTLSHCTVDVFIVQWMFCGA
jgi:hypothetical protein